MTIMLLRNPFFPWCSLDYWISTLHGVKSIFKPKKHYTMSDIRSSTIHNYRFKTIVVCGSYEITGSNCALININIPYWSFLHIPAHGNVSEVNISIVMSFSAIIIAIQTWCVTNMWIHEAANRSNQRFQFIFEAFAELKSFDSSKAYLLALSLYRHVK